jgi:hypothetical protein
MRGLRQVFARGLALSLCQRMIQAHLPVQLRFFDGRLHDAVRADLSPQRILPYLLGFRSTRGRNYGRVFRDLRREVQALCKRNKTRVTLYLITHAECHIPIETVAALRQLAVCNAVFVRPSAGLQLDYLPLLHRYHVVSDEALRAESDRKETSARYHFARRGHSFLKRNGFGICCPACALVTRKTGRSFRRSDPWWCSVDYRCVSLVRCMSTQHRSQNRRSLKAVIPLGAVQSEDCLSPFPSNYYLQTDCRWNSPGHVPSRSAADVSQRSRFRSSTVCRT